MHEVGSRIAGEGNLVAWLCSKERSGPFWGKVQPAMESADGIQVARLGPRILYGRVVRMVLSRLRKRGTLSKLYDAVLNCVTGIPLDLGEPMEIPVLPVVFSLSPKIRGTSEPPGPLIATSKAAEASLREAGFPSSHVIRAPFGAPACDGTESDEDPAAESTPGMERSTLVAFTDNPRVIVAAIKNMARETRPSRVTIVGRKRPQGHGDETIVWQPRVSSEDRAAFQTSASYAYCGAGYEWEAPAMGAAAIPVICAGTAAATEYVSHEETGLVCRSNDPQALTDSLVRLTKDEVLRKRLASRGRERAKANAWERTAELVLSTIENLE
jgi:hypothetical protein